jgi:Rod binding domain-containing protein
MVAPLAMLGLSLAANVASGIAGSISNAAKTPDAEKTRRTAEDFEAMFLEQSLGRMAESVGEDGPLGDNGTGGAVYRSMLSKEHAKSIVKSGGLGIADQVFRQMLQMQEGAGHGGSR